MTRGNERAQVTAPIINLLCGVIAEVEPFCPLKQSVNEFLGREIAMHFAVVEEHCRSDVPKVAVFKPQFPSACMPLTKLAFVFTHVTVIMQGLCGESA